MLLGSRDSRRLWWHWDILDTPLLFHSFSLRVLRSDSLAFLRLVVRQLTFPVPQPIVRLDDLVDLEEIEALVHIPFVGIPVPSVPVRPSTVDKRAALVDFLDDRFPTLYSKVGLEHVYFPSYEYLPVYGDALLSRLEIARDPSEVESSRLVDGIDIRLFEREHDEDATEEDFIYAHCRCSVLFRICKLKMGQQRRLTNEDSDITLCLTL